AARGGRAGRSGADRARTLPGLHRRRPSRARPSRRFDHDAAQGRGRRAREGHGRPPRFVLTGPKRLEKRRRLVRERALLSNDPIRGGERPFSGVHRKGRSLSGGRERDVVKPANEQETVARTGPGLADQLRQRIADRTATIGVIGLGYVGLPLILTFSEAGFPTVGFDVDGKKVDSLRRGRMYIQHLDGARLTRALSGGRFQASEDFARLAEADVVIICVPTPLTPQREPDMSYVTSTVRQVAAHLREGQLIVLESTTYPGTTDELVRGLLEETGLKCGEQFFLAFSPEREDPGNPSFSTGTIPKVVGGVDQLGGDLAQAVYDTVVKRTVRVRNARTAEATKLVENIFRAVNIALANELKMVFDRRGIDVWEVLDAASTKPFGFMRFDPGPGWGGHCIPLDPFYLSWKAREFGVAPRFIELAGEINVQMPHYVIEKLQLALNE